MTIHHSGCPETQG